MSFCYGGMFKRGVRSTGSGQTAFLPFQQAEAGCCRLNSFGGISLVGNSFGGGGGGVLTAKALWFPFQGTHWFPRQQRRPASKLLPGDQALAWDAPGPHPWPRLHCPARWGSELGGRGAEISALQKHGRSSRLSPLAALVQAATHPQIHCFPGPLWLSR